MWYSMLPFLAVFGDSTETIIALRLVFFLLTVGIAFAVYRITEAASGSNEAAMLSVPLLLSMVVLVSKSIEIRPDVPQVLCELVSINYLIGYLRHRQVRHIVISGLAASLSFLFLQKAVFFLIGYGCILLYLMWRRSLDLYSLACFLVSFFTPIGLMVAYWLVTESFTDYILTNWVLNLHYLRTFPASLVLVPSLKENTSFWCLSAAGFAFIFWDRHAAIEMKIVAFLAAVAFGSVFLVRVPYPQYFLMCLPLLSVCAGWMLWRIFQAVRLNNILRVVTVAVIISFPTVSMLRDVIKNTNEVQLSKISYVIESTAKNDQIYDGNIEFNLFRQDVHYFWYGVGKDGGLETFNRFISSKYADYDVCNLILTKKPTFISDYAISSRCVVWPSYVKTKHKGLYRLRIEEEAAGLRR